LNENNMIKSLTQIFEEYFNKDDLIPIYAFKEKQNTFYFYDDSLKSWLEMSKDKLISLMYNIDKKIQRELTKWSEKYEEKINENDKWGERFNRLVGKANTLSYRDDSTLSKLKNILFNILKCEVKRYIEYEFEYHVV